MQSSLSFATEFSRKKKTTGVFSRTYNGISILGKMLTLCHLRDPIEALQCARAKEHAYFYCRIIR